MKDIENVRRWLILEDHPRKAEEFIDAILTNYPDDEVIWFYPYSKRFIDTLSIQLDKRQDFQQNGIMKRPFKTRQPEKSKDVFFYWLKTKDEFFQYFTCEVERENQILLLDVELQLFGYNKTLDFFLQPLQLFQKQSKSLIVLTTCRSSPKTQAQMIFKENNVTWVLETFDAGNSLVDDCKKTVEYSTEKWQKLHKDWSPLPLFSKNDEASFLKLMNTWTSKDCHVDNFKQLEKEGKLCPQYGILKCWVWLLRALYYLNCDDFQKDFHKETCEERKRFPPNLIECLKSFGTEDSYNISPLSMLLITFMNFRKIFYKKIKNGESEFVKINKKFIKSINYHIDETKFKDKKHYGKAVTKFNNIIRYGSVSPLQKNQTRIKTWEAFSKMIERLIVNDSNSEQCNIEAIEINPEHINIHFKNINAEQLQDKLNIVYRHRVKFPKPKRGHTNSQAIIKYLIQSAEPDYPPLEGYAFVGADHNLKIFPKPDNKGIILTF